MPSTATIEATPIAIPSADSAARARRVRRPSAPVRRTSAAVMRPAHARRAARPAAGSAPAIAWSCVIVTIVEPAACSSCSSARMSAPVRLSRLPVGSSANTIAGRPTQRARDRHALALAARELRRRVRQPVRRGRRASSASRARARRSAGRDAGVEQPGRDVVERAHPVEQEELLEHEADRARPQRRQRALAQRRRVLAGDVHRRPPTAARASPSRAAASTCPSRTARRPPPPRPRCTVSDTPRSASTPPGRSCGRRRARRTAVIAPSPPSCPRAGRRPRPRPCRRRTGPARPRPCRPPGELDARSRRPGARAAP